MAPLLLIIDLQNGFVNQRTAHILPAIKRLIAHFTSQQLPVAFTRFINQPDGAHVKWIGWSRLMTEPDINLVTDFQPMASHVFDKGSYTAFTAEFEHFLAANTVNALVLCGIATDGCVLKTAVDAFERHIKPLVVQDACASHAGPDLHEAGLRLLTRFIGRQQLVTVAELLQQHDLKATVDKEQKTVP